MGVFGRFLRFVLWFAIVLGFLGFSVVVTTLFPSIAQTYIPGVNMTVPWFMIPVLTILLICLPLFIIPKFEHPIYAVFRSIMWVILWGTIGYFGYKYVYTPYGSFFSTLFPFEFETLIYTWTYTWTFWRIAEIIYLLGFVAIVSGLAWKAYRWSKERQLVIAKTAPQTIT